MTASSMTHSGGGSYYRRGGTGNLYYQVNGNGSLYEWAIQSHWGGMAPVSPTHSPKSSESSVIQTAQLSALSSIDRTPYSFAEDVAEIRETLSFLRSPLQSLLDLSKRFHSAVDALARLYLLSPRKLSAARRRLKMGRKFGHVAVATADVWLTYRFAFSPLVRSVMQLTDAFNDRRQFVQTGRKTSRGTGTNDEQAGATEPLDTYKRRISRKQYHFEARAAITYQVSNPASDFQFKYGLRFKDIPVTLWAILPYSFMVDRLFDLTKAVSACVNLADPTVSIIGASITTKRTVQVEQTLVYDQQPGWSIHNVSFDTRKDILFTYERTPWVPGLSNAVPVVNFRGLISTATHTTDLLALILQKLR